MLRVTLASCGLPGAIPVPHVVWIRLALFLCFRVARGGEELPAGKFWASWGTERQKS